MGLARSIVEFLDVPVAGAWDMAPEQALAFFKAKGLKKYIRTKEEVDKDALLAARAEVADTIKGITFKQKEEFAIVPHESKIEEVQS